MRVEQLESLYLRISRHERGGMKLPLLKTITGRVIKDKLAEEVRKPLYERTIQAD